MKGITKNNNNKKWLEAKYIAYRDLLFLFSDQMQSQSIIINSHKRNFISLLCDLSRNHLACLLQHLNTFIEAFLLLAEVSKRHQLQVERVPDFKYINIVDKQNNTICLQHEGKIQKKYTKTINLHKTYAQLDDLYLQNKKTMSKKKQAIKNISNNILQEMKTFQGDIHQTSNQRIIPSLPCNNTGYIVPSKSYPATQHANRPSFFNQHINIYRFQYKKFRNPFTSGPRLSCQGNKYLCLLDI